MKFFANVVFPIFALVAGYSIFPDAILAFATGYLVGVARVLLKNIAEGKV